MRRIRFLGLGILVLLVVVGAGGWFGRQWFLAQPIGIPPSADEATAPGAFRVNPGEGFYHIAARLEDEGWIRWSLPARVEARWGGWDRRIYPGYYVFQPGDSVRDLLGRFREGEIEHVMVTIPEGRRLTQILPLLAKSTWNRIEDFQGIAEDSDWLGQRGIPGPGLEGFILPETYKIAVGAAPDLVLEQITETGVSLYADSLKFLADSLGLSHTEVWTLASIVEAEAVLPEERRRISGVFWNRLRKGMRLESDPTVLYALGRSPGRVLYRDLEVDSPYNTYRSFGLPPGPICQPGRASLWAAVAPLPVDDLFFVARGDGSHVFSKTLAEHNRARIEVRRSK